MKNVILIVSVFLVIGCVPKTAIESDKEAISKALHQSAKDWSNGDIESYMNVYWKSDKLQFIGRNGVTYGWQKTLDNYKKGYPTKEHTGILTFDILSIDFLATNVYSLTGKYHLERQVGNADGIFTLIFKKINNKWVIISDHTQG
jgi:ketosteroid isomerase-like protein